MGKYEEIKDRSGEHFRRLTGVRKTAFLKMAEAVVTHENERKKISGRPLKLSYGDQVLMMLEYNREYRTYFHTGADYGMSDPNCSKKKSRKNPLSMKDKRNNRNLSRQRVFTENVIGKIKIFKILSEKYRNRRKRFELRFRLISGIYNFELKSRGNDF